jgi:hypothetical protein
MPRIDSRGSFQALWGAISRLTRGQTLGGPLDRLRDAQAPSGVPARRLLGGMFRPGHYPVLIGPGKCQAKGHRGKIQADLCSRCVDWTSGWHSWNSPKSS